MWITLSFILGLILVCVGCGLLSGISREMTDTIRASHNMKLSEAERKLYKDIGNNVRIKNLHRIS